MLTKNLAKVIGLWMVLTMLGIVFTAQTTIDTMNALFADAPLLWITGVFTLLLGIGIVVFHNRWSGGSLPVIVTLYGWIALIKGMTFLWVAPPLQAEMYRALHFDRFIYAYALVSFVIGGYLTYGGFKR